MAAVRNGSGRNTTNKNTNSDKDNNNRHHYIRPAHNNNHLSLRSHSSVPMQDESSTNGGGSSSNANNEESDSLSSTPVPNNSPSSVFKSNIPRLCCAFLASITTGGTTYAFGLYGNALKKNLHLTQSQLDTISTANFCAGLLSWVPGLFVDRFGTRMGISMGGIIGAIALCLYWQVAKGYNSFLAAATIEYTVATLSALGVTIFLSSALVTGAVFKIIVNNCGPGTKGSAVGVAKGYVGLGAGAYACLFESIRQPTTSDLDFLLMAAFFFVVIAAIPSFFILPNKYQEDNSMVPDSATPNHFRLLYASLLAMATAIVGTSLLSLYNESSNNGDNDDNQSSTSTHDYRMTTFIMFVWIVPVLVLFCLPRRSNIPWVTVLDDGEQDSLLRDSEIDDEHQQQQTQDAISLDSDDRPIARNLLEASPSRRRHSQRNEEGDDTDHQFERLRSDDRKDTMTTATTASASNNEDIETTSCDEENIELVEHDGSSRSRPPVVVSAQENKNLIQMLQSPAALLMLWTATILVGGGTVETNNMGQMVESLHFADNVTPASLALFSVAQAGARVAAGAVSESALNWSTRRCGIDNGVPRPFFLIVASLLGFLAHGILAVSGESQTMFIIGVTVAGASFGTVWPLMVLIVGELFGTAHVAANYMFYDGFTSAGGTLLLSKIVAQEVYESHIEEGSDDEDHDNVTCYGAECFQATHFIIAILSLSCVITSVAMQYSTRHVYNKSILHRH